MSVNCYFVKGYLTTPHLYNENKRKYLREEEGYVYALSEDGAVDKFRLSCTETSDEDIEFEMKLVEKRSYIILKNSNIQILEKIVNSHIEKGWKVSGGVSVYYYTRGMSYEYVQSLTWN